eukprot:2677893-Rhodomonas_salina.3
MAGNAGPSARQQRLDSVWARTGTQTPAPHAPVAQGCDKARAMRAQKSRTTAQRVKCLAQTVCIKCVLCPTPWHGLLLAETRGSRAHELEE